MADQLQPPLDVSLGISQRRRVLLRPIIGLDRAEQAVERLLQAIGDRGDDVADARANATRSYNIAKAILDGRLLAANIMDRMSAAAEARSTTPEPREAE